MEKFIRVMGNKSPKGRTPFIMQFQLVTAAQYLRGDTGENPIWWTEWHRNQREATLSGWQQDTRQGTAVGWEFVSATPMIRRVRSL